MNIISAIALIVCGMLAIPALVVAKKPDAKKLLDKIMPYQGWIGLVVCVWGLWTLISGLIHAGAFISLFRSGGVRFLVFWLSLLATGLMEAVLGFILGYVLISQYALSKNAEAAAKGELVRAKLVKIQVPLGLAGIALGLWLVVAYFILL
jgi:hypothetical protein